MYCLCLLKSVIESDQIAQRLQYGAKGALEYPRGQRMASSKETVLVWENVTIYSKENEPLDTTTTASKQYYVADTIILTEKYTETIYPEVINHRSLKLKDFIKTPVQ